MVPPSGRPGFGRVVNRRVRCSAFLPLRTCWSTWVTTTASPSATD